MNTAPAGANAGHERSTDIVIIGAGAAGLWCAATAGQRGQQVLVLDHSDRPGKKILISGGERCNFTNRQVSSNNFLSKNPHFCRSALARFTPDDFLALLERHGIPYHQRDHGELFCDRSAQDIVDLLVAECTAGGAEIACHCRIDAVETKAAGGFRLTTSLGSITASQLVLATGGLSLPRTGASDFGHRLARQFGLNVIPPNPALVPLDLPPALGCTALSGIAVESVVRCGDARFQENILFTHQGLSGPAILQVSSYWQPGQSIVINLLPGGDLNIILPAARSAGIKAQVGTHLSAMLPKRLVQHRVPGALHDRPVATLANQECTAIAAAIHAWTVTPSGTAGYSKAEVTSGGIDTNELSSKTLEVRRVPGLYAIGEVIDVTGWLGGFNFQWAWASGYACGIALAERQR